MRVAVVGSINADLVLRVPTLPVGGVTMPAVCFLTAWRREFRHAFFVPVAALLFAATWTLLLAARERPRLLAAIPLLSVVWANAHGTVWLAPLLVGGALHDLLVAPDRRLELVEVGHRLDAVGVDDAARQDHREALADDDRVAVGLPEALDRVDFDIARLLGLLERFRRLRGGRGGDAAECAEEKEREQSLHRCPY